MKKTAFLFFLSLFIINGIIAQNIIGDWNGILKANGLQLRLIFHISKNDSGYNSTMDSPDQGSFGNKTSFTGFENGLLNIKLDVAKIQYSGKFKNDSVISGTFNQGGFSAPLDLTIAIPEKKKQNRPQEPKAPYPYYTEDIVFKNVKENIELAGTLSLPSKKGNYPVVILVSGSGPQNRDEELLGHKPFLVIADYLTKNGIGVLRYDDRGTGKSKGNFTSGTTKDFAEDANAAVNYLKARKEAGPIGMAGHSEGGLIAPIVASQNKGLDFIILLAGPGVIGEKLLLAQTGLIAKANGTGKEELEKMQLLNAKVFAIVRKAKDKAQVEKELTAFFHKEIRNLPKEDIPEGVSEEEFIKIQVSQMATPWMMHFIKFDPTATLKRVKCPILALNGSKDLQVPAKMNLEAIKKAVTMGGNKNIITKEMKNLNHLFQECSTGSPSEYKDIEQTFSPDALREILTFIRLVTK